MRTRSLLCNPLLQREHFSDLKIETKPAAWQAKMYQTDKYAHELRYLLVKVTATGMIYKLLMFGIDIDSNQFSRLFISLANLFTSVKRQETAGIKGKICYR